MFTLPVLGIRDAAHLSMIEASMASIDGKPTFGWIAEEGDGELFFVTHFTPRDGSVAFISSKEAMNI